MTKNFLDYQNLLINNTVVKYDGRLKVKNGSKTRTGNPQINGGIIYTTDISTEMTTITIPVRAEPESNARFEQFYTNGDNNTITIGDTNYIRATMTELPEIEDQEVVEYVFTANIAS